MDSSGRHGRGSGCRMIVPTFTRVDLFFFFTSVFYIQEMDFFVPLRLLETDLIYLNGSHRKLSR